MKKTVLGLLILFSAGTLSMAQNGADDLKNASKLLAKYNKDPFANAASLSEATSLLTSAFDDETVKNSAQSWVTRGDIYKGLSESQQNSKLLNPEFVIEEPMSAALAAEAYIMADDLVKDADAKTAKKVGKGLIEGMKDIEGSLNNYGVALYQEDNYDDALSNFLLEMKIHDLLKAKGEESRLDDATLKGEKLYFIGVTATLAKQYEVAIPYLEQQEAKDTAESVIYQFLYEAYNAVENEEKAAAILTKGRSAFPDDANLLFSEINYYLKKGDLEKMITNLEAALEKEPDNVSVITTLGQVYDQLSVTSDKDGDSAKSEMYYNKASEYYSNSLNGNPENFDLNYSMGALHYNRAATLTDDLNALADDFSSAGVKKYDGIKDQMASYFDKALPYFLKADTINSKDRNTLIALKEILVRKDDFAGSEAYKVRLESLEE